MKKADLDFFCASAKIISSMSYAVRRKVGGVLVRDRRIIAHGYNGTLPGHDNVCEFSDEQGKLITKSSVLHAEENIFMFCAEHGIKTKGCTLVLTCPPCARCARQVLVNGIEKVYYFEDYISSSPADDSLATFGIEVVKYDFDMFDFCQGLMKL